MKKLNILIIGMVLFCGLAAYPTLLATTSDTEQEYKYIIIDNEGNEKEFTIMGIYDSKAKDIFQKV